MSDEKLYEQRVITNEGAKHYLIKHQGAEHYIHHRWDGPAIEPTRRDSKWKKGYFLSGIEYDLETYQAKASVLQHPLLMMGCVQQLQIRR